MTEEEWDAEIEARCNEAIAEIARITGYDAAMVEELSDCNCPVFSHLRWGEARIREEYARRKKERCP
jgi:hypothetical protein